MLLAAILALAFALRVLGVERVFPESGDVVFAFGDPYYHLRLALYSWTRFPEFLQFDSYLHHPLGAHVPWPPLYDLLVAGSARIVGGGVRTLELVAAWWPPLLGTLTALATYAAGRLAAGRACGLLAAILYALLPASAVVSRVGYADHHAAVACLGATWLALQLASLRGAGLLVAAALAVTRVALILTWVGSLVYLGVAELSFVLVSLLAGLRRALVFEAVGLAASALWLCPAAAAASGQLGGPFSALQFSWLHVAGCAALAVWAGACSALLAVSRWHPFQRSLWAILAGALLVAALLTIPGVLAGLEAAHAFFARGDLWSLTNPEQAPLFSDSGSGPWAWYLFGALGFLLPVAPLLLLALAGARRDAALALVAGWGVALTAMALLQVRFSADLAPSFSVICATLLLGATRWLGSQWEPLRRFRTPAAAVLALVLLWPTIRLHHLPGMEQTIRWLRTGTAPPTPEGSLLEFAKTVRASTPETSWFLDPRRPAEYGILADPSLGHALHYVARRPTLSDNFGPYIGKAGFDTTLRLLLSPPHAGTLDALHSLGIRYVVTSWQPRGHEPSLLRRLHEGDGRARGDEPALVRFRLVAEGPPGGVPLHASGPRGRLVAYKLFEVVEGADLEVRSVPGDSVTAQVTVAGPDGRRFVHRVAAIADEQGCARLRLPYATRTDASVRPRGPYKIKVGSRILRVEVGEREVREGIAITVPTGDPPGAGADPAC